MKLRVNLIVRGHFCDAGRRDSISLSRFRIWSHQGASLRRHRGSAICQRRAELRAEARERREKTEAKKTAKKAAKQSA